MMSLSTNRDAKIRQYSAQDLELALNLVNNQNKSLYAASKATGVPWSSIKDYVRKDDKSLAKLGRPFALTAELEIKLYHYIITMQELGFGLTVNQIRHTAFDLAKTVNRDVLLNPNSEAASKWWCDNFKKRYNLTLRVAENLSACRASMANPVLIADFYDKLENLLDNLDIKDCADRIWNCDETGLSYVTNKGRVVAAIGRRYIYNRTYAEKGTTTTVMGCICADGTWLPPLVIFKGVRWSDNLKQDALPNTMVKLSPKGWINAEIFLEWFQFFINSIPDARPVLLLMDSHASHIKPEVIQLARENQIYLLTFPAHNTHILQPLDVGVYKALKSYWSDSVKDYMKKNATQKPDRSNFHQILNPAFVKALSSNTIKNAFRKCGICPLNKNALCPEALAPSRLTEQCQMNEHDEGSSQLAVPCSVIDSPVDNRLAVDSPVVTVRSDIENILKVPTPTVRRKTGTKRQVNSRSRCLNDEEIDGLLSQIDENENAETEIEETVNRERFSDDDAVAGPSSLERRKGRKKRKEGKAKENVVSSDDDWVCSVCEISFSYDARKKNGKKWVECSYCCRPYHNTCLNIAPDDNEIYVQCDACAKLDQ